MTTSSSTSATPGQPLPGTVLADSRVPETLPRKSDGTVDWRAVAMTVPSHFYVKAEHKETVARLLGKSIAEVRDLGPEDIVKVPDRYLVIRKAGILRLAEIRGYVSEIPDVQFASRDYVIVRSLITWTPFEGMPTTSGGVGEANPENTTRLGAAYLAATAENRATARNVRDYLQIDIVSSDELGKDGVEPEQAQFNSGSTEAATSSSGVQPAASPSAPSGPMDLTPQGTLARAAAEGGFSFEDVKDAAQLRWDEDSAKLAEDPSLADSPTWKRRIENDPAAWTGFSGDEGVPPRDCLTLTNLIKAAKAAQAQTQAERAAEENVAPAPAPEPAAAKPKRTVRGKVPGTVTPISAGTEPPVAAAA